MQQIPDFADSRNKGFCVHCGGTDDTRDHVPSKVFLDEPFPANLPQVPACGTCNAGFSLHEEYLACLLECVVAGTTNPARLTRERVRKTLNHATALRGLLERARIADGDSTTWSFDRERVATVLLKLARGHAAFELGLPQLDEPDVFWFCPLVAMTGSERRRFEHEPQGVLAPWPEVGSRAFNRLFIAAEEAWNEGWLVVQADRYRYVVSQDDGLRVRIVLRGYLACEAVWS